ncbi:MAG: endonuclease/exonuclease/phosphatase family protein [Bacteroidetes bacterium]|nr:endonuclease/exonuclease/phosphatase family protein [Bacteroidota bacterium]
MEIISWNCNGALRKKFQHVADLNADIYIIQECEDPARTNHSEYSKWGDNHLWIGDNKNKGIGIFAKESIKLEKLNWSNAFRDHTVKYFLPCLVNDDFQLLGVWTHKNNSPNFGYMGQFWKYLKTNLPRFEKIIIAGDFNSNAIWDEWDRWWNHSDVVEILKNKDIRSIYHEIRNESQGKETNPTFFLQRKREKPYHIDYFFTSSEFETISFEIGKYENWIETSDHVPITYEF